MLLTEFTEKNLRYLAWLLIIFFLKPALRSGYDMILVSGFTVLVGAIVLIFTIYAIIQFWGSIRFHIHTAIITGFISFTVFLLPYILWALNKIPNYNLSIMLATLFSSLNLLVSIIYFRRKLSD